MWVCKEQEKNKEIEECWLSKSDHISFSACSLTVLSFEELLYSAVLVKRSIYVALMDSH